jgi:hypothetical protein
MATKDPMNSQVIGTKKLKRRHKDKIYSTLTDKGEELGLHSLTSSDNPLTRREEKQKRKSNPKL